MKGKTKEHLVDKLRKSDISCKKVEEVLGGSQLVIAGILDNVSELVVYQDVKHRVLWTNKSAGDSVDSTPEQLVNRYCYEIWHQRDKLCVGCPVEKVLRTGEPQEGEITTPDGRMWFIKGYPNKDTNGDIAGVIELTMDITEHKRAERNFFESEEKYRLISENTSDLINMSTFSLNPVFTYVSPSIKKYGYEPEDLLGKPCFDLIHPDDKKKLLPLLKKYVKKMAKELFTLKAIDISENIELRSKDKSGNWHYMECTVNHINNKILYISRDVTKRKQAEEELKKRLDELEIYYRSTKGRESRIVELKHEVNALSEQLGKEKKYGV